MRAKITRKNYGKYYETIFVCSSNGVKYCDKISKMIRENYGIYNCVLNFEKFDKFEKQTKKDIRRAHCVIFVLSDDVVESIDNAFSSENTAKTEMNAFAQMYKYVNEVNSHAIACVISKGREIKNDLEIPQYMGDFERLHRLELTFADITGDTKLLCDNIRHYYSNRRKKELEMLARPDRKVNIKNYYYDADYKSKECIVIISILIVGLLFGYYKNGNDKDWVAIYYLIASIPVFILSVLKNNIKTRRKDLYMQRERIGWGINLYRTFDCIIYCIIDCIIYASLLFLVVYLEEELDANRLLLIVITAMFMFGAFGVCWTFVDRKKRVNLILQDEKSDYIDVAVDLWNEKRAFSIKQIAITFGGTLLFIVALCLIECYKKFHI